MKTTNVNHLNNIQNRSIFFYLSEKIDLKESYISLILGVLVVFFFAIILLIVLNGRNIHIQRQLSIKSIHSILQNGASTKNKAITSLTKAKTRTYQVKDGDDLWDISLMEYGRGDRWMDIYQANNLDDPDSLATGQVLQIPR